MTAPGFLVDSHILIWSLYEPNRLNKAHLELLNGKLPSWISVATVWEIEIKRKVGKLPIPELIWQHVHDVGHQTVSIEREHAVLAGSLPLHHRDPFDRMIVAQAMHAGFSVMTTDKAFRAYPVSLV